MLNDSVWCVCVLAVHCQCFVFHFCVRFHVTHSFTIQMEHCCHFDQSMASNGLLLHFDWNTFNLSSIQNVHNSIRFTFKETLNVFTSVNRPKFIQCFIYLQNKSCTFQINHDRKWSIESREAWNKMNYQWTTRSNQKDSQQQQQQQLHRLMSTCKIVFDCWTKDIFHLEIKKKRFLYHALSGWLWRSVRFFVFLNKKRVTK